VRKLTVLSTVLTLGACSFAASAGAFRLPPNPNLPPGWSHATINIVVRRVAHTLTYDRGRVVATTSTSITLREPDGTMQTISVDGNTRIVIAGQPSTIDQIRPFEIATTVSVDGGAAAVVRVQIPPRLVVRHARRKIGAG
jgi:hypothetical protein